VLAGFQAAPLHACILSSPLKNSTSFLSRRALAQPTAGRRRARCSNRRMAMTTNSTPNGLFGNWGLCDNKWHQLSQFDRHMCAYDPWTTL
jgi:hypothetical protein